jgi:hypothetical protein
MAKIIKNQKSSQEILDEAQKEVLDNLYGAKARRKIFFSRFGGFKIHAVRILLISVFVSFAYLFFSLISSPPGYSREETKKAEENLATLLEKTGESRSIFEDSLVFLKKYPQYYKKVVNNIQDIEIKSGVCPYACIYSTGYYVIADATDLMMKTVFPEANLNKKILIIDPSGGKRLKTEVEFASMLVHETDHVEYMESGRLRRAILFFKCNPILNPNISINSNLPSISHRVKTIEICAEKEQIKFHEITNTKSGYEAEDGIYYNFPAFMLGAMNNFLSLFFSLFKSIFGIS